MRHSRMSAVWLAVGLGFTALQALGAVGRIPGQSGVTATGESAYSLPFNLPPGTRGLTPQLRLSYSSDVGLAIAGVGWTIAGSSAIVRCPSTVAQDGIARNVRLDSSDRFCLNGQKLRLASGTYGAAGSTYRTEIESYSRITAYGVAGNGPANFIAEGLDGLIYEFGNTADSRIESLLQTTVRTWALNRVRDRDRNEILFSYTEDSTNGAYRLNTVSYTGNPLQGVTAPYLVQFSYQPKPLGEVDSRYFAGRRVKETDRLQFVTVTHGSTVVRRYQLIYEALLSNTSRSRLASVKECAGSPLDCLPETVFTYENGSIGLGSEVITTTTLPATPIWSIDVNGDGRDDVVYSSSATSGSGTWRVMFATSAGIYAAPTETGIANTNYSGSTPIDYNADGKIDLLVPWSGYWHVMLGSAAGLASPLNTGAPVTTTGIGDNARAMDIDGDGLEDLVWADIVGTYIGGDAIRYRRRIPGGAFDSTVTTLVGPTIQGQKIAGMSFAQYGRPADINGDGRADIVYRFIRRESNTLAAAGSYIAGGDSSQMAGPLTYYYSINVLCPGAGAFESSESSAAGAAFFGDFNADGKTDIWYQSSSGYWVARFSTGMGLGPVLTGATSAYGLNWIVKDWDGDGYDDLIAPNSSSGALDLFRSTGEAFSGPLATGTPIATGTNTFQALDVNGDGHLDLGYRTSANLWRFRPHVGSPALPDLLKTAQDGFGIRAEFSYLPITNASVYTKGSGATFPAEDVQYGRWVVSQWLQSDGTGTDATYATNFTYEAARKDLQGRGFLGFAKRTSIDTRLGYNHRTIETYRQDFPFIGALASIERQQATGTRIDLVSNTWARLEYGTGVAARAFPYVSSRVIDQHEVGGPADGLKFRSVAMTVASVGGIDASSGTVLDQTTTTTEMATGLSSSSSLTERLQHTAVLNDTTNWCLGRPTATELTRSHTLYGGALVVRTSDASWDGPTCRLTQARIQPGTNLQVTIGLGYDAFGNESSQSVTGSGMAARVSGLNWGSTGRYLTTSTNALGHVTAYTWDVLLGLPTSTTDPNGITTSWGYDAFGRVTLETRPDGTSTSWTYTACAGSCDNRIKLQVLRQDRDASSQVVRPQIDFYDRWDRLIWQQSQLLTPSDTTWSARREFDALGALTRDYAPYRTDGAHQGYRQISYDALGRPTAVALYKAGDVLQSSSGLTYAGLAVTGTDALSHSTTRTMTAWGTLARVLDAAGGQMLYDHDAFRQPKRVTDPAGNVVSEVTYNVRGMRTQLADMDLGTWSFTPNALGEVVSQTDAKNQTTTFSFDALGRLYQRIEPEGTSTFTFGAPSDNTPTNKYVGRLKSLTGPGYGESFVYDSLGRPKTRTIVSDQTYQFDYAYSPVSGELETLTYPTSTAGARFKAKMGYTAGYLTSVQDFTGDVSGPVLWNLNLLDARFNAVSETYGNGLWLQNGYDALTGAPLVRRSGTGGLEDNVQNLGYAWDAVGNLTGRSDLRQSLLETFQYDALDRLTQASGPAVQATTVGYDAIGNLTSKTGVGSSFAYHPTKKHALTSAGGTAYGYDGNGNLTSRGGATVTWSSYNYPTAIGDPNGYSAQFSYAPDRSRWRQVSTYAGATETTVYVGGLLQKFTNAVTTHWKHLIPTPSGEVQVIRRANGSTETLYVTTDHLGSTDAVLDAAGAVVLRASFAAQGERRASGWQGVPSTPEWQAIAATTRRGYTGHETLDNVMLVHMNGRVYDPRIGRFLSADPYIDGADTTQGWNRYSYVHNNPLNATDPTGFWELPDIDDDKTPPGGFSSAGGYIYGSRVPEREPNRIRNAVLAQREADLYAGQNVGSTVGGNAIGVLYGGTAYIVSDELVGDYSCAKTGQCRSRLVVRPDCNVLPAYKHSGCEAVYPSLAIENTILAGVGAFSLVRAAIATSAPEAVIARLAQAHANSGLEALAARMSIRELAAVQAGSRATPAIMGQAVHNAVARSLAQIFPGKYLYFPRAPFDFVYLPTGQVFELTTFGQAGSHAARGADLIFYTLPR